MKVGGGGVVGGGVLGVVVVGLVVGCVCVGGCGCVGCGVGCGAGCGAGCGGGGLGACKGGRGRGRLREPVKVGGWRCCVGCCEGPGPQGLSVLYCGGSRIPVWHWSNLGLNLNWEPLG